MTAFSTFLPQMSIPKCDIRIAHLKHSMLLTSDVNKDISVTYDNVSDLLLPQHKDSTMHIRQS